MKKLGITGGIAAGKSEMAQILSGCGWCVIDTDQVARDLCAVGQEGYEKVIDAFGSMILNKEDDSINRNMLGRIVFEDSSKRLLLNSILHPLVREKWQRRHAELVGTDPAVPVVVVIPLLFETQCEGWFDSIACVACSDEVQMRRLGERGLTSEQSRLRIEAQWPMEQKTEKSHVVVWNNGSLEMLEAQARMLLGLWEPLWRN